MSSNNRISDLVKYQLPFFVRNDHETFVAFLEAYYEFLEQESANLGLGKVVERSKNVLDYFDVDKTLDALSIKLYNEFIQSIPQSVLADRDLILKHVKDFYRAKGSEKALKFILRILTNKEVEIYYPKKDILRASDGKWYIQKALRITNTAIEYVNTDSLVDFEKFVSTKIVGSNSAAFATVEKINRFYEFGTQTDELIITNIHGTFESGETITTLRLKDDGSTENLTANVFSGALNSIRVIHGGLGYVVGDEVVIEPSRIGFNNQGGILYDSGTGGLARVSRVSQGNVASIGVFNGGAGFRINNNLLVSGGGGTGANGYVNSINDDETYHQNTYNIFISLIDDEANTEIANTVYSNLSLANANVTLANSLNTLLYGPCGPAVTITLRSGGSGYDTNPSLDIIANTRVKSLGILGRMEIISGGEEYRIGDVIEFVGSGYGANAAVSNVDVANSNTITAIAFTDNVGFVKGGYGYSQSALPTTNIRTTTGANANVIVTAIIGDGEILQVATGSIGSVEAIEIQARGSGYTVAPQANLIASGDGNAQATVSITQGVFLYPGRYLNDDGHLGSFNFLQNKDYYQNFSYVVKVSEGIKTYKKLLKDLGHPIGLKLFSEFTRIDQQNIYINVASYGTTTRKYVKGTYVYSNTDNVISVTKTNHGLSASDEAFIEFIDGDTANLDNSVYVIDTVPNSNNFTISYEENFANTSGNLYLGLLV